MKYFLNAGALLLLLTLSTLFIIPVLPDRLLPVFYPLCFTGIIIAASLSLERSKRFHVSAAIILSAMLLIAIIADLEWVQIISRSLQGIYFIIVVMALVREIASSRQVNTAVIVNAITAYFLLGMALSLVATIIAVKVPNAYNIDLMPLTHPQRYNSLREMTYYTFITYTTTGYGDITPTAPASRSLAVVISSFGQLYIAIIIAMLMGKFTSASK